MNKNIKRMFFVTTLILLLVSISAISATDASNDTSSISQQDMVKEVNVEKVSDNTITDTTSKNIKKEATTTDLYVSDTDGSDDNSGTQTSPYKTIQKALDTTNADSTFNIHIAEGTYKGLGNTNLTVNGNYNINIIGRDNTILDGEVRYDLKKELGSGEYYWESSPEWYPYQNGSGNWAMNITAGNGLISITNLTIQNCWNPGGTSISEYETATVDNYGNLAVTNVSFINNCGGVGSAIRNNKDSTLTVTDSYFSKNRKSNSTGNMGIIYNNGTATIINTTFDENLARWGSILNDRELTLINSTLQNNIAYDGTSTYKYGSGLAINSANANFFEKYDISGITTTVENTSFINNDQTDLYTGTGNLTLNNSRFTDGTGIYINTRNDKNCSINITNNNITHLRPSSLFTSLSVLTGTTFGIYVLGDAPVLIDNNTILHDNNGYGIYAENFTVITNNNMNKMINLTGNNHLVQYNTVNVTDQYAISLTNRRSNITITDNILESAFVYGNQCVLKPTRTTATIQNNIPVLGQQITITDETYPDYFNNDGTVKDNSIPTGSTVTLSGNFYNRKFVFDDIHATVTFADTTQNLYNTSIIIKDNGRVSLTNFRIDNQDYEGTIISVQTVGNLISNIQIRANTTKAVTGIEIAADKTRVQTAYFYINSTANNKLNDRCESTALDISSSHNLINTGGIYMTGADTGTIVSAYIISKDTQVFNNTFNSFTFNVTGCDNAYGLIINNSDNNTISFASNNYIDVSGKNSTGIYIVNNSNNNKISSGTFYLSGENKNSIIIDGLNTINENNTINSTVTVTNDTNIIINNSYNGNIDGSSRSNTILIVNNSDNMNIRLRSSFSPQILLYNTNNSIVNNSRLNSTLSDKLIILNNSNNNTISNNYLNYNNTTGGNALIQQINSQNNTLENNTPEIILLTDENYNDYFTDSICTLNDSNLIVIGSDLYNKDLTFENKTFLINPFNKTIYNGTLTFLENAHDITFDGLNFYSNDERTTIIHSNASHITLTNLNLYQENHENIVRTIVVENKVSYNTYSGNITVLGPEIKTQDDTASTILLSKQYNIQTDIQYSNITMKSTKSDNEGYISVVYGINDTDDSIYDIASVIYLQRDNIDISGNNVVLYEGRAVYANYLNLTMNTNNTATIIKSKYTDSIQCNYNNITVNSNNTVNLFEFEDYDAFMNQIQHNYIEINSPNIKIFDAYNTTTRSITIRNITLDINTTNITLIKSKNATFDVGGYYGGINLTDLKTENLTLIDANNSKVTFSNNLISATVTNNDLIKTTNKSNLILYSQNIGNTININTTNNLPLITINDSTANIKLNNITQNTTQTPIILATNSNVTVVNNSLITMDLVGDNAVETIDSIATVENNTPTQQPTIITIETDTLNQSTENSIIIKTTDMFDNPITGEITATINGKTYTAEDNILKYTPSTTDDVTITVTYTDPNEKYSTNTTTKTLTINPAQLIVNPINAKAEDTINITANIISGDTTANVSAGKVTFKVNGKTLKDTNGKVIYAKVINGTATIENYVVPEDWAKAGTTIQAVYSGSSQCEKLTSEKTNITVTKAVPTLTTEDVTATVGGKITLKATITDNDKIINTGKIVFKINGKTVKDENGKVIYAKVVNGTVSVDYTLPESYKAGNYTVTATFIASGYDKLVATETLTVTA